MEEILYSTEHYTITKLVEPLSTGQENAYFHYAVKNTKTDTVEGYAQFLPSAMEKAVFFTETMNAYYDLDRDAGIDGEENVVKLNS